MIFNPRVFERLLFPLNKRVYRQIQDTVGIIENKHPGKLHEIISNFGESSQSDTQTPVWRPGKADNITCPSLDISILFDPIRDMKLSLLHKFTDYKIAFNYEEKASSEFKGSHLIVGFHKGKILNTFIVPLEYVFGFNEKSVLREGSYQVYSHTILSPDNQAIINNQMEFISDNAEYQNLPSVQQFYQKNSLVYVGITKRTWQERYRQHCREMGRGSNLLFHRALRGEYCEVGVLEHIVERAGLTEKQAYEIEEREVEKRSLHLLYPNGLNMIPGGYAGLKCIHRYASRTGFALNKELSADDLGSFIVDIQRHILKNHFKTTDIKRIGAEIARLWAEDINYRINATTNHTNRFSFRQIQAARILDASGWTKERILEQLQKLDTKIINMEQLEKLLRGETYASIPDVLI